MPDLLPWQAPGAKIYLYDSGIKQVRAGVGPESDDFEAEQAWGMKALFAAVLPAKKVGFSSHY